jgi:hypothetical protein
MGGNLTFVLGSSRAYSACVNLTQLAIALLCLGSLACAQEDSVRQVGRLQPKDLKESSGLVVSRTQPGVLWTHNDGGGRRRQILYGVNRSGELLATFPVTGVELSDWEDIANDDKDNLFIGDIGNNDAKRNRLFVHRVHEPNAHGPRVELKPEMSWELRFPGEPFDCESLFIQDQVGYVISKMFNDQHAVIYKFSLAPTNKPIVLEEVAKLPVTSPVTGAALSKDNRLLGLVSKSWVYVFKINGDVASAGRAHHHRVKAPVKDLEGCDFDTDGFLATAETKEIFLFSSPAFVP